MRKTMAAILCVVMFVLCIPLMPVSAEENDIFIVSTGVEFVDQWNNAAVVKGTVKLERDVSIANEYNLNSNRTLTIDLNGHTIKGVGDSADYIFNISGGGSLTVKDSSEAKNGKILVTRVYEDYEEVIIVNEGGKLTLDSGTLQGNEDDDCRLIAVESGTFIMNGGSVTGNTYNGDGAGIYINEGSFTMNGGSISNNHGDNDNDYGGAIFFDGSTDSRLYIRGGEIFGNSAYDGGAVYLDDGYAEFTGGKIYNNTSDWASAIEVSGTSDSVKLAGDLLITKNKCINSKDGSISNNAAVNVRNPFATTGYVYLGGKVKIYGNGLADFNAEYGRNEVHIMDDMDISPENHAWIGVRSGVLGTEDYIDCSYKGMSSKNYTVCFFGTDVNGTYYEPVSYSYGGEPYVIGVSHKTGAINDMKLNESGIKGSDGKTLTKGVDYTMSYDSLMCEYSITAKQPITFAEAGSLFTNNNSKCNGTTTLAKTVTEESDEGTTYTYYYLSEYYLYDEPYLLHNTSYNSVKQSYYTIKVFVPEPEHSFTSGVYKDNGDGTHSQKCTDCDEYGTAENHIFVDGVCICGAKIKPDCEIISVTEVTEPAVGSYVTLEFLIAKPVAKLQFVDKSGNTFTYSTTSDHTLNIVNNDDGTQVWTVEIMVYRQSDTYSLHIKDVKTGWSDIYYEYTLADTHDYKAIVSSCELPPEITEGAAIKAGQHDIVIKTNKDVSKVQFAYNGETATYTPSSARASVVEEDDCLVWTISQNFYVIGENITYTVRTRTAATSFEDSEISFTVNVTR